MTSDPIRERELLDTLDVAECTVYHRGPDVIVTMARDAFDDMVTTARGWQTRAHCTYCGAPHSEECTPCALETVDTESTA